MQLTLTLLLLLLGSGGSIVPSGSVSVNYGASQTFIIGPVVLDYRLVEMVVDGVSQGEIYSYTFTDVIADHTIFASFSNTPDTPTFTLTANPTTVDVGGQIQLTGTLSIPKTGTITLTCMTGAGQTLWSASRTLTNGVYTESINEPGSGTFQYKVSWPGDGTTNPATSNSVTVTVNPTPTLTVTSPNGGESWARGSTHSITWSSVGNVGSNVKIELMQGGSVYFVITESTPNDGSFSGTIPAGTPVGANYRIRITSTSNPAITDNSNANFSVI